MGRDEVVALADRSETPSRPPLLGTSRGREARRVQETILALKLRKAGYSYQSIAETLSENGRPCSPARANRIVLRALAGLERMQDAEALQLRNLELERLDDWQRGLETRLEKGDPKAVMAALALQGRRLALQGMPLAAMQGGQAPGAPEDGSSQGRVEGGGLGLLAYAELRVGLSAPGAPGVDALRGLLSQALQAGALRHAPALQAPQPALPSSSSAALELEAEGDADERPEGSITGGGGECDS